MEYGLFIRNRRTGRWINLSAFAKVLHHWSGGLADGSMTDVPGMHRLLMPVRNSGNGADYYTAGNERMHRYTAASLGLSDVRRVWHAVTLISNSSALEGTVDDLESVPGGGCILNYEDYSFYTSPDDTQRRNHLPVRILTGVVYE